MRLTLAVALVLLLALAPGTRAADQQIVANPDGLGFAPSELTVNVGDKVTVTKIAGSFSHNVHYDDETTSCPATPTTSSWTCERTFATAGNYTMRCDLHTSTVHVGTSSPTPTPGPTPGPGPTPTTPATPGGGTAPSPKTVSLKEIARLPKGCARRRSYRIRLRNPKLLSAARVFVNGKRKASLEGAKLASPVKLKGLPKRRFTLAIEVTRTDGSRLAGKRRVRVCTRR
jgi:plastocyanin